MDPYDSDRQHPHAGEHVHSGGGLARTVQLVADTYLLTVNPVDGSEIEPCPPGELPVAAPKLGPDERPAPPGAVTLAAMTPPSRPLLEREEERERLARLLARGRSVRLTGPAGSGRTALLDAVAEEVAGLAPDGVVRLSGHHRTPSDLLHELFTAVHDAPLLRPDRNQLNEALAEVGAVVVLDDLEFGGAALDEVLRATPECAYLLAATPDIASPASDSRVEEVFLAGLSRTACLELLEHTVRRPLTDEEADWAADLWFDSEGHALRFVQAGALLLRQDSAIVTRTHVAALVPQLLATLPDSALGTLRLAVALDGELPHHTHLPALTGDQQADDALPELVASGLISPAGGHFRLAAGVAPQLAEAGLAEAAGAQALAAAQHYTWWTGHPSVTPERVAAEADALLSAARGAQRGGNANAAVLLARTAAPLLASALRWSAWERTLRCGQEAARTSGEIAEEAYFHHELGVLALATGNPERARAELEAAVGLRGTLAEQRGVVAGRRALALVADRLAATGPGAAPGSSGPSQARSGAAHPADGEESAAPPVGSGVGPVTASVPSYAAAQQHRGETLVSPESGGDGAGGAGTARGAGPKGASDAAPSRKVLAFAGSKRNVVAAGAGALLAAVLGTIVTLGTTSDEGPPDTVRPEKSASQEDDGGLTADEPAPGGDATSRPQRPVAGTGEPGTSGATTSPGSKSPEESPSSSDGSTAPDDPPSSPDDPPTKPTDSPTKPTDPPTKPTDPPTEPTDPPTEPTDPPTTDEPPTSPSDDTGKASRPGATQSGPDGSPGRAGASERAV